MYVCMYICIYYIPNINTISYLTVMALANHTTSAR